jgi:AraC family transcriptional regulator, regulatory protein of adaptative response / methylated-DNA-[protein]-cysteine methyltransferase
MGSRRFKKTQEDHLRRMTSSANQAVCWRAVRSRDRKSDGKFVYAVRSTGIYCRASCASRKPGRHQVVFFPTPDAAEQNGFRPCRRCRPRTAHFIDPRVQLVARVCREIDSQLDFDSPTAGGASKRLTLVALGATEKMSPYKLERAFRSVVGITPRQYAYAQRIRRLKSHLRKGNNVTTSLYEAGFSSSSRLYEQAHAHLGMTPDTYRRGGAGMNIRYTIAGSPLGRVLIGATDRGISAVYMGDSDVALESALRKEYPRAHIQKDSNDRLEGWTNRILAHLRGQNPHLDLPRDVQATAFQRRVWDELRRIPPGVTRTYSEVARAIGKPTATRAVARACATNPIALVVPCHRVVRQGGNLAGYRWGINRKQALLAGESKSPNAKNAKS